MKIENWKSKINSGFTLVEMLVAIGILTVVASIGVYFFASLYKKEALEKDTASLVALINQARMLSVSSKDASAFGVHLQNDKAVLFEGFSYVSGGANEKTSGFSGKVQVSSYALAGGGSDIVFDRLTGNTSNSGTIVLSLKDGSASTTVTVLQTGVVQ